jgi:alpha-amylase
VPFIYYGEEIGMVGAKPDERIRTPMQWDATDGTAGFTTDDKPWEPLADNYADFNVAAQTDDPGSLLSHYRALIHLRNEHAALRTGDLLVIDTDTRDVYSILRYNEDETLLVLVNAEDKPVSDYALTLDEGPLAGTVEAVVLMGEGDVSAPTVSDSGGFEDYLPLPELPAQSSLIIQLVYSG